MSNYNIISSMNKDRLISDVERHVKEGWMPQGGPFVTGSTINQAMTKIEVKPSNSPSDVPS